MGFSAILVRRWGLQAGRRLDTGRRHAGAVVGFTNAASQIASLVSSIAFGYLGGDSGNYNLPFIPMVVTSSIGAVLWLKIDPAHQVFDETPTTREVPMAAARA